MANFPPSAPTTLTKVVPSYLYQEYSDDEDLQAFVSAFNELAQQYVNWFALIQLSVYTGPLIAGTLLDWVAEGLYGMYRPILPSGNSQNLGALNTITLNSLPLNEQKIIGPPNYFATSDDAFKRILTWHLWRGDGREFTIKWLKRRVMRFLTGTDGGPGQTDTTYPVSVTFGVDFMVNINLQSTRRFSTGGSLIGVGLMNTFYLEEYDTTAIMIPISPLVPVFKAAVEAGVLELPFQFDFIVNVN